MDAVSLLKKTLDAVKEAGLPPELREAGFRCAYETISASTVGGVSKREPEMTEVERVNDDAAQANTWKLSAKAKEHGLDPEELLELFTESEGKLALTIDRNRLAGPTKRALLELTLILCFLRQGAGWEDFTTQDEIAIAADYYGLKDSNFSRHMKDSSNFLQMKTEGGKRSFRLRRTGWEQTATVISRVLNQ